ncbi:iron uptake porin [Roseofilum sp. BLCC_M154]|uniref:Iron uptake porin n=1 Tax=Roseofilum acuticapitatum BLCC-M154 TaxID=3022444 RepID=A0ABT7AQ53_9CYAN|nr:iron uptake porin [Roseofilum acuticapitatum]MDJ1168712.1 iron uptake porin [Roseofilum acuticapitatum BLCC-M154]
MSKFLWKTLLVSPAVLTTLISGSLVQAAENTSNPALVNQQSLNLNIDDSFSVGVPESFDLDLQPSLIAQERSTLDQVIEYSSDGEEVEEEVEQVTSVSQLRDVRPTDWAFQALQSLVERYGCIAGYPDGTYRGNRAITRYEFAAGLNACLDRVNELIAAATANAVTREDLAVLQRLQEEFAAELATLRGRVDALEARTTELEANQFSTTTKLVGEAIFAVTDAWGADLDLNHSRFNVGRRRAFLGMSSSFDPNLAGGVTDYPSTNETALMGRVRLNLNTSFTGKDLLLTRMQAASVDRFNFQQESGQGLQTFQVNNSTNGDLYLDKLQYYWSYNNRLNFVVSAIGGTFDDFVPTLNPYFEDYDGGSGSLNTFSQRNPLYRIGGGAGIGMDFNLGDFKFLNLGAVNLSVGYLTENGENPTSGNGLFNGDYGMLTQLTFTPSNSFSFAFTYAHGYHDQYSPIFDNGYGYDLVGTPQTRLVSDLGRTSTNSYGGAFSWRISPKFVANAFVGYTDAKLLSQGQRGSGEIWTYGLNMAFPDLFRAGNVGGLSVGVPPTLAGVSLMGGVDNATPVNIEGFYKIRVSDNISLTPGVTVLISPFQDALDEDTAVIGTLRTTFSF